MLLRIVFSCSTRQGPSTGLVVEMCHSNFISQKNPKPTQTNKKNENKKTQTNQKTLRKGEMQTSLGSLGIGFFLMGICLDEQFFKWACIYGTVCIFLRSEGQILMSL